jgi:hypothetical protein
MFKTAFKLAAGYTRPVVISSKTCDGACGAGIGAFVIVNRDGWIVTADHIIGELEQLADSCARVAKLVADRAAVEGDGGLDVKARRKQLSKLGHPPDKAIDQFSSWWSVDGSSLVEIHRLQAIDLAVGRLEPFDPSSVAAYPVFKNHRVDFTLGASLCRLGFPFYDLQTSWNPATKGFSLPPGSIPIPLFAIDGIFSREVIFNLTPAGPGIPLPPFPLKCIETSTPGLRGQSGGPIFDPQGRIWGIQSRTKSYPLGFDPDVPGGKKGDKEYQFLNVGWGIHAQTVTGMLADLKVSFSESKD